jgi:hypothetical protein
VSGSSLNLAAILPMHDHERSHFHFFQQRTAFELSDYFDAEFYNQLMLQISREEPAIRHAVISLGALHRCIKLEEQDTGGVLKKSSLAHYSKAIKQLSAKLAEGQQSVMVTLICCLVFVWLETLLKNESGRMQQTMGGLKIVREWKKNLAASKTSMRASDDLFIEKQLVPLFARLDIRNFHQGLNLQLELHLKLKGPQSQGIPAAFSSVAEARDWFDAICYNLYKMRDSGQLPELPDGWLLLLQWDLALDKYMNRSTLSETQKRTCTLLRIYQRMALISIGSRISLTESNFEPFDRQFRIITDLAETLFNASDGMGSLDGFRFPFEMGIVAPLYFVSLKCNNQETREKAQLILSKCPKQGGVWDGLGVSKLKTLTPES